MSRTDYQSKGTVLLSTVHGSRLYGLNHSNSDDDRYIVTGGFGKRARQTLAANDDVIVVSYEKFVDMLYNGTPQAVEALFSEVADVHLLTHLRDSYLASNTRLVHRYLKTIKSFALTDVSDERVVFKRRRHALRLADNLNEIVLSGRFDVRLSDSKAALFTEWARMDFESYMTRLETMLHVTESESYLRGE